MDCRACRVGSSRSMTYLHFKRLGLFPILDRACSTIIPKYPSTHVIHSMQCCNAMRCCHAMRCDQVDPPNKIDRATPRNTTGTAASQRPARLGTATTITARCSSRRRVQPRQPSAPLVAACCCLPPPAHLQQPASLDPPPCLVGPLRSSRGGRDGRLVLQPLPSSQVKMGGANLVDTINRESIEVIEHT